jgi:hypothetical protein
MPVQAVTLDGGQALEVPTRQITLNGARTNKAMHERRAVRRRLSVGTA